MSVMLDGLCLEMCSLTADTLFAYTNTQGVSFTVSLSTIGVTGFFGICRLSIR
jgi:hypothetical protein